MKDYIYAWLMFQINKPFTQDRAEAVYNVLYLLYNSGYEAPEWEAVVYWLSDGDATVRDAILETLKN